jgi:NNP family nitrate/nitrite transporter-like MFS transporter
MSTIAFTVCFAVWTIFSIIGVRIKQELGLSETEFGILVAMPILTGSLVRLVLGVWTERYGGRLVYGATMLVAAGATFLLSYASTYAEMLIAALGVGIAGGSFAVGVAYVTPFVPAARRGTALGIFGAGNIGAAVTKFLAPFVLLAWGWEAVAELWAAALAVMAVLFWCLAGNEPARDKPRRQPAAPSLLGELAPLRNAQVWRFSLYYFFAFGGFVALALWLPRYLVGAYGFDIATAGIVAAAYSIPGSIFRIYGGVLSDRIGARSVMYLMLCAAGIATLALSLPPGHLTPNAFPITIGPAAFIVLIFILGFFMSLGKAAVYKHIPTYYPDSVGAVGGIVGMVGGLGGFILPIAFGLLKDLTGLWSSCFMLLFVVIAVSLAWMHFAIRTKHRLSAATALVSAPAFDLAAH